jgi:hypothetical protein
MRPCKGIPRIQVLRIYFFATPPIKTEMGTQNWWEQLIANHLDQPSWLTNQKQGIVVRSYSLHSFLASAQLCFTNFNNFESKIFKFVLFHPSWNVDCQFDSWPFFWPPYTKHPMFSPLLFFTELNNLCDIGNSRWRVTNVLWSFRTRGTTFCEDWTSNCIRKCSLTGLSTLTSHMLNSLFLWCWRKTTKEEKKQTKSSVHSHKARNVAIIMVFLLWCLF